MKYPTKIRLATVLTENITTALRLKTKRLARQRVERDYLKRMDQVETNLTKTLEDFFNEQITSTVEKLEILSILPPVNAIFNPGEWDQKLVDRTLPILAKSMFEEAAREYKRSVKVAESKSFKIKSTATDWLTQYQDPNDLDDIDFTTPLGKVTIRIGLEFPPSIKKDIVKYLQESFAQNYWQKINETTGDDIEKILEKGLQEGWSISRMAKEMAASLPEQGKYALRRGKLIARTEAGNALNGARVAAMDAVVADLGEAGTYLKKVWLSILAETTRDEHANLDGVPCDKDGFWLLEGKKIRWPGDVVLSARNRCNCFPGFVLINGEVKGAQRVWYDGVVTKIKTRFGISLTVTPNHPIMTSKGWKFARQIEEGDQLACCNFGIKDFVSFNQKNNEPISIQKVFESIRSASKSVEICSSQVNDFYGDGVFCDGDIDIVGADRVLLSNIEIEKSKDIRNFCLSITDTGLIDEFGLSSLRSSFKGIGVSFSRFPGVLEPIDSGCGGSVFPHQNGNLGLASGLNVSFSKNPVNHLPGDSEGIGNFENANSRFIFLDDVVSINVINFSGHVYDLHTKNHTIVARDEGLYNNNGIITHNCWCSTVLRPMTNGRAEELIADYMLRYNPGKTKMMNIFGVKVFCPTGPGGGVDPTCSPGGGGSGGLPSWLQGEDLSDWGKTDLTRGYERAKKEGHEEAVSVIAQEIARRRKPVSEPKPDVAATKPKIKPDYPSLGVTLAKEQKDQINQNVRKGIALYTSETHYRDIQRKLREKDKFLDDTLIAFDKATKTKLQRSVEVYRGCSSSTEFLQLKEGEIIERKGFNSFSLSPKEAMGYTRNHPTSVVVEIKAKTGLYVEDLTSSKGEYELVQSHKSRYKYLGREDISIDDIDNDFQDWEKNRKVVTIIRMEEVLE